MNPVNPWLDPEEVRRLAESLLRPVGQTPANLPDAGFGGAFEGFAVGPEAAERDAAPGRPVGSSPHGEQTAAQPAAQAPAAVPRHDPFTAAAHGFRQMLAERFSATGVFILDGRDALVFDEGGHGKLVFLARGLALAARRNGDAPLDIRIMIGSDATLEVIPVEAAHGRLVAGALVPQPLPPDALADVKAALAGLGTPQVTPTA